MAIGRTTVQLMLMAALLISAGCTSRGGRSPLARSAKSSDEVLPKYSKTQLLAAARQYEKEGLADQATLYYQQVLALEPENAEAKQGLQIVQSGQRREDSGIKELIAESRPAGSPLPRSLKNPTEMRNEVDEQMALLIAEAAAHAEVVETDEPLTTIRTVAATTSVASQSVTHQAVYAHSKQPAEKTAQAALETQEPAESTPVEPIITETEVKLEIVDAAGDQQPADWAEDSHWQSRTVTRLCKDANAAVLREVAKLDHDDPNIRKEGLWALAQMGADASSATEAVKVLLKDDVEIVSAHAAWVTWELTGNAATPIQSLTKLLSSTDAEVVQFAAFTLTGMGNQAQVAVPALRQRLQNGDGLVRLHLAEALATIGTEADKATASATLIFLTTVEAPRVRMLALMALGESTEVPSPEIATAVTSALHDSDADVRSTAALTLGSFGKAAESALPLLQFVAESDQQDVRQAAETAIACIRR